MVTVPESNEQDPQKPPQSPAVRVPSADGFPSFTAIQEPVTRQPSGEGFPSFEAIEPPEQRNPQDEAMFLRGLYRAVQKDPNNVAEIERIATDFEKRGIAVDRANIGRNVDVMREYQKVLALRYQKLQEISPTLAKRMLDDTFAGMAWDDTANLSWYERSSRGREYGNLQEELGSLLSVGLGWGEMSPEQKARADWITTRMDELGNPSGFVGNAAYLYGQFQKQVPEAAKFGAATAGGAALYTAVTAAPLGPLDVPATVAAGGAGFIGGFSASMLYQAGRTAAALHFHQELKNGYPENVARMASFGVGALVIGTEAFGGYAATRALRGMTGKLIGSEVADRLVAFPKAAATKEFLKNYVAYGIGGQTAQELFEELGQVGVENITEAVTGQKPKEARAPLWDRLVNVAVSTAQGITLVGLPLPVARFAIDVKMAQRTEQQSAEAMKAFAVAVQSALRERNPEAFRGLLADQLRGKPGEFVYFSAKDFASVLNQPVTPGEGKSPTKSAAEQLNEAMPETMQAAAEAVARGEVVKIPTADYAAHVVDTDADAALRGKMRFSAEPDALTTDEAAQVLKDAPERAKALETELDEQEQRESQNAKDADRLAVEQIGPMLRQVRADRGQAKQDTRLLQAVVETLANRLKMPVADVWAQFAPKVMAGEVASTGSLSQGENTEAFKTWFGDSKVVDDGGKPLRVFHGTATDFTEFDIRGLGSWFTSDPAVASEYSGVAARVGGDPRVVPTFLAIRNPAPSGLVFDAYQEAKEAGHKSAATAQAFVREWLTARGYDGIVEGNKFDGRTFVAFKPEQIKSATGNRGTFDPNDPNILHQPARGWFHQLSLTIGLTKAQNASTFGHELAHYTTEVYGRLAATNEAVRADFHALIAAHGVTPEQWAAMTPEQQKPIHEGIARQFETYLQDGKAPTVELEGVFARLGAWIRAVYRIIASTINSEYRAEFGRDLPALTPEVRAVFDRWLASDDQIARAEALRNGGSQFDLSTVPGAELTEEEQAIVRAHTELRREGAISELTRRVLAATSVGDKAKAAARKESKRDAKARAKEAREEAARTVQMQGVYRLREWLRTGRHREAVRDDDGSWTVRVSEPDKSGGHKLNTQQLRDVAGTQAEEALTALEGSHSPKGEDVQLVAEVFFGEGTPASRMLDELLDAPPIEQAIEAEAKAILDREANAEVGDQEFAIVEAINSEVALRYAGIAYKVLAKLKTPTRILRAQVAYAARQRLGGMRVSDIDPRHFSALAAKAEREMGQALGGKKASKTGPKGGPKVESPAKAPSAQEAVNAANRFLLYTELAKQAAAVRRDVDRSARRLVNQFFRDSKKLAEGHTMGYVEAGRAILRAYAFHDDGVLPLETVRLMEKYAGPLYTKVQPIVEALLKDGGTQQDYRNLSLDKFRDVEAVLETLWDESTAEKRVEIDGKRQSTEQFVGKLVANALAAKPELAAKFKQATNELKDSWGIWPYITKIQNLMHQLDGGALDGPWQQLFRMMTAPHFKFLRVREGYLKRAQAILAAIPMGEAAIDLSQFLATKKADGSTNHTGIFKNTAEFLGAIWQSGNESNLRAMGEPYGFVTVRADGTLDRTMWDRAIDHAIERGWLTKDHMDGIKALADLVKENLPTAQRASFEMRGEFFPEVPYAQFTNKLGTWDGWYAPAALDEFLNREFLETPEQAPIGNLLLDNERALRAIMPAVGRGFMQEREQGALRYRKLDLRTAIDHIDQVLRYAHMQPAVRDAFRVFHDPRVAGVLNAIDPNMMSAAIDPWLKATTDNRLVTPHQSKMLNAVATHLRRTAVQQAMFFNTANALQQATGLSNLLLYVDEADLAFGIGEVLSKGVADLAPGVIAKSDVMFHRVASDASYLGENIDLLFDPSKFGKAQAWTARHSMFMQRFMQIRVDLAGWIGAYRQATKKGLPEAQAVAEADQAVVLSQGSSAVAHSAAFERGSPFHRFFTAFTGYYLSQLNAIAYAPEGRRTQAVALALILPTLASTAIAMALSGFKRKRDPDDDEQNTALTLAMWAIGDQVRGAASLLPVIGAGFGRAFTGQDDQMSMSVVGGVFRDVGGFLYNLSPAKDLPKTERGRRAYVGWIRTGGSEITELGNIFSYWTGIPTRPFLKAAAYGRNVQLGQEKPESVRDWLPAIAGTRR